VPDRMPEARHLQLGKRYRRHLLELFKGSFALARETHARQAGGGRGGYGGPLRPTVWIGPGLTVEPLATLYRRRAASYQFVRGVLEEAFGAEALAGLHGLTPAGPREPSLTEELRAMELLFAGAYFTAAGELGMEREVAEMSLGPSEQGIGHLRRWAAEVGKDADLAGDARMMVPVFYDLQRRRSKVWAFLGWQTTALQVNYVKSPRVLGCERVGGPGGPGRKHGIPTEPIPPAELPQVRFTSDRHELATPVVAEVYVERLLNRDEFRRHCDRHKTRDAILANLA
jgi:hypothetical protein